MNPDQAFDIVIIGAGPGGYSAAIRAAQLGLKTALVEKEERLGGICLNWGCIPTKALLKQAELYRLFQRAGEFGFEVDGLSYNWQRLIRRSRKVADGLARGVTYLMKKNQIQVFRGAGRLTPAKMVEVRGESGRVDSLLKTGHIIVATGGKAQTIGGIEIDGENILSSREAMVLGEQPESVAIVGAGAIGVEFAYFFNAFGTTVTLLEAQTQLLPREDEEVAGLLEKSLQKQGINIETSVEVKSIKYQDRQCQVAYRNAKAEKKVAAEKVLMAIGVVGNTRGLGLEALGVRVHQGAIEVDDRMRTNVKEIYALGDVVGPPQLAHVAVAEAVTAVEAIAGVEGTPINRSAIPSCTYCQPQVASVGLTEKQAREAGYDVKVGRFPFAASGKARAVGETDGLVKLIFDSRYGEVLGATIIGSEATELIAEVGLARNLEATYEELLHTVHAHPTLSEAVMEAAGEAFGRGLNI